MRREILRRLLASAVLEIFRERLSGFDFRPWLEQFEEGLEVTSGDLVGSDEMLRQAEPLDDLTPLLQRLGVQAESPAHIAPWSSLWRGSTSPAGSTRRPPRAAPATGDDLSFPGVRAGCTMTSRYARWDGTQDPFGPAYRSTRRLADSTSTSSKDGTPSRRSAGSSRKGCPAVRWAREAARATRAAPA